MSAIQELSLAPKPATVVHARTMQQEFDEMLRANYEQVGGLRQRGQHVELLPRRPRWYHRWLRKQGVRS